MAPTTDPAPDGSIPHPSLKLTTINMIGGIFCSICQVTFRNKKEYDDHYKKHNSSSEIKYTCVVCRREILGYASFRGHCYTSHVYKKRFKCNICAKHFSKQTALKTHNEATHKFKCVPPCNKEFRSKKELTLHQIIHKAGSPPYSCQKCQGKIISIDNCEQHLDKHVHYTFSCPICEEKFNDRSTVTQHLTTHFEGESFQNIETKTEEVDNNAIAALGGIYCNICDFTYKNKIEFDEHYVSDHPEEDVQYSCNKCRKVHDQYSSLACHCYNHYMKGKFTCVYCERSFTRNSLLVAHSCSGSRVLATEGLLGFTCGDDCCGKMFKSNKELIIHKYRKPQIDSYCRQCGMKLDSLAACEKHLNIHTNKCLTCPVCDKIFYARYYANIHLRTHFQTVVHICKICGKVYHANYRLVEHMKVHSVNAKFECKLCNKQFVLRVHYEQHMRTHTGERPFKCVVCEKEFVNRPNWYKHVKRMHQEIDPKTMEGQATEKNAKIPKKKSSKANKMVLETDSYTDEYEYVIAFEDFESENENDSKPDEQPDSFKTDTHPGILEEVASLASCEPISEAEDTEHESIEPNIDTDLESIEPSIDTDLESIDPSIVEEETDLTFSDDISRAMGSSSTQNPRGFYQNSVSGAASQQPSAHSPNFPCEYGPDFVNHGLNTTPHSGHVINLDDHILPHIDPLLTIQPQIQQTGPTDPTAYELPTDPTEMWEPPIITKVLQSYPFDQMTDISSSVLSLLNTDFY